MVDSGQDERNSPPPPPPPPPPSNPHSKISPYILKLRSAPHGYFYQSPKKPQPVDLFAAPTGPYFFYGTLTDPSMIAEILELIEEPKLRPSRILGYECKMWGQYPALLDSPGSVVEGAAYHVRTTQDAERLAAYETGNYRAEDCIIRYTDGKEPSEDLGYTFKFVGRPSELTKGEFDLQVNTQWKQDWQTSPHGRPVCELTPAPMKQVLRIHRSLPRPLSTVIIQMRTGKIELRHYSYQRRVPNIPD